MTESAEARERQTVASLFVLHAALLIGFDVVMGFASLRTTAMTAAVSQDAGNGWQIGGPALVALLQFVAAAGVLACGGFEGYAGARLLQGHVLPTRGPALAGLVGSVLLLPTSVVGCSACGFLGWPLALGVALSTAFVAFRAPDPRAGDR